MNNIRAICTNHGFEYIKSKTITGGDINAAFSVETTNGSLFLKLNAAATYPAMFVKEAEGLQALKQASLLKVPEVIATGEFEGQQYLLMEWLQKAQPSSNFWQRFAEGLALLHSITNFKYGWEDYNYIGSLRQENNYTESWAEFYAIRRILPLVKKLFDETSLSKSDVHAAERLCNRLEEIFPVEPASLLHGDLWAGNFIAVNDNDNVVPSVYDAAVYYGHREMDLGMSLLFGGFNSSFYEWYQSFFPLEKNWRTRVPLTQLYPLLVHAILFGGGYINQCRSTLNAWK